MLARLAKLLTGIVPSVGDGALARRKLAEEFKEAGNKFLSVGDLDNAEDCFRRSMEADPGYPDACNNMGVVFERQGRIVEACSMYRKALSIDPGYAKAHVNLGLWHKAHGSVEEQLACFEQAIEADPGNRDAHLNLGATFQRLQRREEAMACYRNAIAIDPGFALAHFNLGLLHRDLDDFVQQVACLEKALALDPDYCEAHYVLGQAFESRHDFERAEKHYRAALRINPECAEAQLYLGMQQLLLGDYENGLALYEQRFRVWEREGVDYRWRNLTEAAGIPRWTGGPLEGKAILVWMEQGLGDSLMMLRFLPQLMEKGAKRIFLSGQPALAGIVTHLPCPLTFIDDPMRCREEADCHCALTSLPYLLGTRLATIPGSVPYIVVPRELKDKWKERVSSMSGPKVGLAWAGNKSMAKDCLRSIALAAFEPLIRIPGTSFVSLQKGDAASALKESGWPVADWMDECGDLLDTAALIESLDLVISVDTSVAHLAGALGKPVWLLNRFESEWRWMTGRQDSPWYPTMRIFRQPQWGDWESVIGQVADALRSRECGQD